MSNVLIIKFQGVFKNGKAMKYWDMQIEEGKMSFDGQAVVRQ